MVLLNRAFYYNPHYLEKHTRILSIKEGKNIINSYFGSEILGGYIYFLTNEAMPGLYKIGSTTKSVEERMAELYNSSAVPVKFKCELKIYVPECKEGEFLIHEALKEYRVNQNREFFRVDMDVIMEHLGVLYNRINSEIVLYRDVLNLSGNAYYKTNYESFLDRNYETIKEHDNNFLWFCDIYKRNNKYYHAEAYNVICTQEEYDEWLKKKLAEEKNKDNNEV